MNERSISRRTVLKGMGTAVIGLPFLEEMAAAATTASEAVPMRAFNLFFGLGIPAPLQTEGFDGVLEPLRPLGEKLLIMRNVDHVRCDEKGINAHFDGAAAAFTAEPPDGEAKSGGPSIDQVIRHAHYPAGLPAGMVPTLVAGTFSAEAAFVATCIVTKPMGRWRLGCRSVLEICSIGCSVRSPNRERRSTCVGSD